MLARDLSNAFTKQYLGMRAENASPQELNAYLDAHSQYHGQHLGRVEDAEVCCGQIAGLIDSVKGAGEVIDDIVTNMNSRLEELKGKVAACIDF